MSKKDDPRIIVIMPERIVTAIDDYRYAHRHPSRTAAILMLLEEALAANGIATTDKPPTSAKGRGKGARA
jgi:hypothetical protein